MGPRPILAVEWLLVGLLCCTDQTGGKRQQCPRPKLDCRRYSVFAAQYFFIHKPQKTDNCTAAVVYDTRQGDSSTYKIRIDTKHWALTEWKIYGRKSGCKNAEISWGGRKKK